MRVRRCPTSAEGTGDAIGAAPSGGVGRGGFNGAWSGLGTVGDSWMFPDPNVALWEIPKTTPYILVVGICDIYRL